MKSIVTLGCLFLVSMVWGQQQLLLTDPDYDQNNPLDCAGIAVQGGGTNFEDGAGNYAPNTNDTLVLCPDLMQGSKVSVAFATNAGFVWDVDASDTLYVYDGPNTSSPLIGAYNSSTDPNGFFAQASWSNPTGCLTLVFISNGQNEGAGWAANVACGDPPQPFIPHIEAFINGTGPNVVNPLDTGYIDVCFGDTIMLVSNPDFPNSFETNGYGYSQNNNNCTFDWTISGIGQFSGDTIYFLPPQRTGYYVDLRVIDQFPYSTRVACKIRVSQLPSFEGTGPLEDTVCLGSNTQLVGGTTLTDTVGVEIPNGQLEVGGVFAGLTPLPDGSGVQYTTDIAFASFGNAVVTSVNDIEDICLDIEHSYLGDLEATITCPNGSTATLINTFTGAGEMVPGGCNGGGTYLGNDTGIDGGAPGSPVWTYCFSELNATGNTFCNSLGNTIPNSYGFQSMNPATIYLPESGFGSLVGCPLNGPWTITIQDNLGIDDGYIFQWGINFNASLYPAPETYQNTISSEQWQNDPTIISGQDDTLLVVQPDTPGNYGYTYTITDDFGCVYDTTVYLYVLPQPTIQNDTLGCFYGVQLEGTNSYGGGSWAASDTAITFSPNNGVENPFVLTSTPGTYTLTYTDSACNSSVDMVVNFPSYVWAILQDTTLCQGIEYPLTVSNEGSVNQWNWSNGQSGQSIMVTEPGLYSVEVSNECHSATAQAIVDYKVCDIVAPNVISLTSMVGNNIWSVKADGLASFNCRITNRWGNLIYEYNDPNGGWDGTSNGQPVSEGTYFYIIDATIEGGEELQKHGFIEVLR